MVHWAAGFSSFALYSAIRATERLGVRRPLNRLMTRFGSPDLVAGLKSRATRAKVAHGNFSLVPVEALEAKYRQALACLIERQGRQSLGDYLEFGVFNGASLAAMYRALQHHGLDHVRLFGFDSFEGLPKAASHDDGGYWTVGSCYSDLDFTRECLSRWGVDLGRVHLVKGWFSDTLNKETVRRLGIETASVVMIDCDLYSSAKEALTFAGAFIGDEAILFFDDMEDHLVEKNMGEKRAFDEFLTENPYFDVRDLGSYGNSSRIFWLTRRAETSGGPRAGLAFAPSSES
jgi:hypothetical protein